MSKHEVLDLTPVRQSSTDALTPMDMLNAAITRGANMDVLEKLMSLHERWEANQARKAFNEAIAVAKGEIPPILKNCAVDFSTGRGRTNYKFESLADIAREVDPVLNRHGLTYRFRAEQNGKRLRVTCILSHRDGYFEETSLETVEDDSGNKNAIQAVGSAATYLQRYTLKLALGLSTTTDDDGRATSVKTMPQDEGLSIDALKAEGRRIAKDDGMTALGSWWTRVLTAQQRKDLGTDTLVELKALAMEASQ